jgi:hypothetical protein
MKLNWLEHLCFFLGNIIFGLSGIPEKDWREPSINNSKTLSNQAGERKGI